MGGCPMEMSKSQDPAGAGSLLGNWNMVMVMARDLDGEVFLGLEQPCNK